MLDGCPQGVRMLAVLNTKDRTPRHLHGPKAANRGKLKGPQAAPHVKQIGRSRNPRKNPGKLITPEGLIHPLHPLLKGVVHLPLGGGTAIERLPRRAVDVLELREERVIGRGAP